MTKTEKHNSSSSTYANNTGEVAHGQLVLVSARWVLILVGLVLTIWNPAPIAALRFQILIIFVMAAANFYLHAQALMKKPISNDVIYMASAADLAVVTVFVLIDGGFKSPLFTFYFPAVMAFAVVFPTTITYLYTGVVGIIYSAICFLSMTRLGWIGLGDAKDLQVLVARVVILVAIAVCGNVFLRIERARRSAAEQAHSDFMTEFEQQHRS